VYRRFQVTGHCGRGGNLLGSGDRRGHQDSSGAGRAGGGHVAADVANDHAALGRDAQRRGRIDDHAGLRLAAPAPVALLVWAHLPGVERPEELLHAGVDLRHIAGLQPPAGDSRLIAHHAELEACRAKPIQCRTGAPHRAHEGGIPVVRHVLDERAVAVEEDRLEQMASHVTQVPGCERSKHQQDRTRNG
jgi:hypothetical protein